MQVMNELNSNQKRHLYYLKIVLAQKKRLIDDFGWSAKQFAVFCRVEKTKPFLKENTWDELRRFSNILAVEIIVEESVSIEKEESNE